MSKSLRSSKSIATVIAEIFVNCAEVKIAGEASPTPPIVPSPTAKPSLRGTSAPTDAPVPAPTLAPVPAPTLAPVQNPQTNPPENNNNGQPEGNGSACCSYDFKTCATWGNESQDACEALVGMKWLPTGALTGDAAMCLGKDAGCGNNPSGCCDGLVCDGNQWWKSCKSAA
jgi:hypothetical protein